jgi:formate dehydrogenase maturation protein FdhE
MIDFEACFGDNLHTEQAYPYSKQDKRLSLTKPKRIPALTSSLRRNAIDKEMGFLPLLAAAVPMVTSLAGSLLSKKSSKGGGPPPEAAQAQGVLDILTKAIGGDEGSGENSIKEVVRNIVSTVPSPVQKQVMAAIKELKNAEKAGVETRNQLVNAVDAKFAPQVTAMLAALKAAQIQKQATYEHDHLKKKEAFRSSTTKSLADIQRRLIAIEQRFARSAIVQGENKIALLGGRAMLER